jgi:hypothetical protein
MNAHPEWAQADAHRTRPDQNRVVMFTRQVRGAPGHTSNALKAWVK